MTAPRTLDGKTQASLIRAVLKMLNESSDRIKPAYLVKQKTGWRLDVCYSYATHIRNLSHTDADFIATCWCYECQTAMDFTEDKPLCKCHQAAMAESKPVRKTKKAKTTPNASGSILTLAFGSFDANGNFVFTEEDQIRLRGMGVK